MKVEILSKTRMRDRTGTIVTRYGGAILRPDAAQAQESRQADVQITVISDDLGAKDVGDTLEIA